MSLVHCLAPYGTLNALFVVLTKSHGVMREYTGAVVLPLLVLGEHHTKQAVPSHR